MATVIIWLDDSVETGSSFRDKLLQYSQVQLFTGAHQCIDYITSHSTQRLFLIASGSLAETVVPRVNEYEHLKQIFIFCSSIQKHIHWAVDYTDKLLMFEHPDDLLERLWREMEQDFRKQAEECIQQANALKERADEHKQSACG